MWNWGLHPEENEGPSSALRAGVPHSQPLSGGAQTTGVKAGAGSPGVWRSLEHMQCSVLTCCSQNLSVATGQTLGVSHMSGVALQPKETKRLEFRKAKKRF